MALEPRGMLPARTQPHPIGHGWLFSLPSHDSLTLALTLPHGGTLHQATMLSMSDTMFPHVSHSRILHQARCFPCRPRRLYIALLACSRRPSLPAYDGLARLSPHQATTLSYGHDHLSGWPPHTSISAPPRLLPPHLAMMALLFGHNICSVKP